MCVYFRHPLTLTPGARLGAYEITAAIGAGGMGEVYRARDTKLQRDVAIKVLPEALRADAARLARLTREAQTLASLNHPNIAHIHGLEESGGVVALVMEFVDGEDLSAVISRRADPRSSNIELDWVLPAAKQIADALEAAHEQGIIHRDLKPANIKVRPDGVVKVLDFGLAKATDPAAGSSPEAMNSPTLTSPAMTQAGMILGTAAYMSPEQARGRAVDRRADIWAFGAVVFEMLTGRRAFPGDDVTDTIVSVVSKEPDWSALPTATSPALRQLLVRCLKKDPRARLRDIGDARVQIEDALNDAPNDAAVAERASAGFPPQSRFRTRLLAVAALAGLVLAGLAVVWQFARGAEPGPQTHAILLQPPGLDTAVAELSPDGRMVVWSEVGNDTSHPLWIQSLDQEGGRAIPGTEGASYAFWSPDGKQVAFFADRKLKRVAVAGGTPSVICDVDPVPRGGSWNKDDVIIFSAARIGPLSRVSAAGGIPQPLTTLDKTRGETSHRWPYFLPDGKHFLYFATPNLGTGVNDAVMFGSLDGKASHVVLPLATNVAFDQGQLLFSDNGRLMRQRFDPGSGTLSGQAMPLLDDVHVGYGVTRALFAASDRVLIAASSTRRDPVVFAWLASNGTTTPAIPGDPTLTESVRLAPDGVHLLALLADPRSGGTDVWLIDPKSGARSRLTIGGSYFSPLLSQDGTRLFYVVMSDRATGATLISKPVAGGDETVVMKPMGPDASVADCTSTHCVIVVWRPEAGTNYDLLALRIADGTTAPVVATPYDETNPRLSPSGNLVAYEQNRAGTSEVLVRDFPSGKGLQQISNGGGSMPTWSHDGHELYYLTDEDVMVVPVSATGGSSPGQPRKLRSRQLSASDPSSRISHVEVAPDGRLLAEITTRSTSGTPYRLVINWGR